jgi:hypothetical protein
MDKTHQLKIKRDAALIELLGGAAALARVLGFADHNGRQRVNNWKTEGIPDAIMYTHGKKLAQLERRAIKKAGKQ